MNEALAAAEAARQTWTPGSYGIWSIFILLAGGMITAIIKVAPLWRKLGIEGDASLRVDLFRRITELEASQVAMEAKHALELKEERERCDERLAKMEAKIEVLQNILINTQRGSTAALELAHKAPTAAAKFGIEQ